MRRALIGLVLLGLAAAGLRTTSANDETDGAMTADEASAWLATERQALLDLGATPANLIPEGV